MQRADIDYSEQRIKDGQWHFLKLPEHVFYNSTDGQSTMQNQLKVSAFPETTDYLYPSVRKAWTPIMNAPFSYYYPLSNSVLKLSTLAIIGAHCSLVSYVHGGPIRNPEKSSLPSKEARYSSIQPFLIRASHLTNLADKQFHVLRN